MHCSGLYNHEYGMIRKFSHPGYGILLVAITLVFSPVISASTVECENLLAAGVGEYNAGDYSSALQVFDLIIQKDASWPYGWLWKGTVLKELGAQEEAEIAFKKGRCLLYPDSCTDSGTENIHDTDDYTKTRMSVQTHQTGPYPQAGYYFTDLSHAKQRADPDALQVSDDDKPLSSDPEYLERRGDQLMELGLYEQALPLYLHAEQINPKNPVIPAKAGDAFNKTGDIRSALDAWNRSLHLQPEQEVSDTLRKKRSDAYELLNEPEKAVRELEEIQSLTQKPDILFQKGKLYSVLHEYASAEESFQNYLSLSPENPDASLGLARAQISQGKISKAKKTLESVQQASFNPNQSHRLEQLKKEVQQYPKSESDDLSFLFSHPELYVLMIVGIGGLFYFRDTIFR